MIKMETTKTKYLKGMPDAFRDIEYIEISKNRNTLITFEGKEVNGLTKYEFQLLLGKKLGADKFSASLKFKNNYTNKKFPIRGIILGENKILKAEEKTMPVKDNTNHNDIAKLIERFSNVNPTENFNQMLGLTKTTYEGEISRLKESIADLKMDLNSYKTENKELQKEIIAKNNELNENEGGSGILDMLMQFNQLRNSFSKKGATPNVSNLENVKSDAGSIPEGFLNALGKVDYSKVPAEDITKYIALFDNIANQLPLKEKE